MLSVNDTIILTGKVRNKAVAKNQLATARVVDKIGSELKPSILDRIRLKLTWHL